MERSIRSHTAAYAHNLFDTCSIGAKIHGMFLLLFQFSLDDLFIPFTVYEWMTVFVQCKWIRSTLEYGIDLLIVHRLLEERLNTRFLASAVSFQFLFRLSAFWVQFFQLAMLWLRD